MKALSLEAPLQWRRLDIPAPAMPGPGEALVRVDTVGICGTDLSGYLGKMPFFSYPRIPGHELGVEVVAVGPGVTQVAPGDRCAVEPYINCQQCYACRRGHTNCCEKHQTLGVHCDGGLRPQFLVPARKLHISRKLSYEQLALVETLAIGCHAVNRSGLQAHESCLIIGAGPIGLATLEFVKLTGAKTIVLDMHPGRLEFCRRVMGVSHTLQPSPQLEQELRDLTDGHLPDVVIDATGNNQSMSNAFGLITHAGRLVFVGITTDIVQFKHPQFHRPEGTLLCSRNALSADFTRIIRLIEEGRLDTGPWITHRTRFDELIEVFPSFTRPETGVIKAVVEVGGMSSGASATALPETVLQFGAGRFLRAFTDRFIHQANLAGQAVGRVVVVQSTPGNRAAALNASAAGFHVVVRGLADGQTVDRVEPVGSISRAISAAERWGDVLEVARSPQLRLVVSNATEAGYAIDPADSVNSAPPVSFPAKLLQVLWARFEAGLPGVAIIPCELIEHNAVVLRGIVEQLAGEWKLSPAFGEWLSRECGWVENLVDCIVTPAPAEHPLNSTDPLLVTAEPYMLWALARPATGKAELFEHPAIQWVDSVDPYYLRKVRILNGLHTAMAAKFAPEGFETVLQVMHDKPAVRWLRGVAYEEILPTIAHRVEDAALFADQVFERFANPFLAHRLADIAKNHEAKVAVRLRPTAADYRRLYGQPPRRLSEVVRDA